MALLFMDSFDANQSTGLDPGNYGKWGGGSGTTVNTPGRTGWGSLRLNGSSVACFSKQFPTATGGGFVFGAAIYVSPSTYANQNMIEIYEGGFGTLHMALAMTTGGVFVVKRGTTTLATGTTVIPMSSWVYVEFKTMVHDTTGSYEVRIDGVSEAALTATGVDTRNGGTTGQWNSFILRGITGTTLQFDDLYVLDMSGSVRNDFLGAIKIEALIAQTDAVAAGSNAGLTCSTGTDHGALVDETTVNTTDYNSGSSVGLKDTYNFPSMTGTGVILGIQTNLYAAKSDAGARQMCPVIRHGGVDYDGANQSLLTAWTYYTQAWAQTPVGSPADWTAADVNALQAGMKVTL